MLKLSKVSDEFVRLVVQLRNMMNTIKVTQKLDVNKNGTIEMVKYMQQFFLELSEVYKKQEKKIKENISFDILEINEKDLYNFNLLHSYLKIGEWSCSLNADVIAIDETKNFMEGFIKVLESKLSKQKSEPQKKTKSLKKAKKK